MKVKGRNKDKSKIPSPQRQNKMICAIYLCQDTTCQELTKVKSPFWPHNKLDLCNNYILEDPEYIDRFCINFSRHCVLNQVDLNIDLLDNVFLIKNVLQPQKNKKCRPTQIEIKENNKEKEITFKNQKFRSVSTQLHEEPRSIKIQSYGPVDSRSRKKKILQ